MPVDLLGVALVAALLVGETPALAQHGGHHGSAPSRVQKSEGADPRAPQEVARLLAGTDATRRLLMDAILADEHFVRTMIPRIVERPGWRAMLVRLLGPPDSLAGRPSADSALALGHPASPPMGR